MAGFKTCLKEELTEFAPRLNVKHEGREVKDGPRILT